MKRSRFLLATIASVALIGSISLTLGSAQSSSDSASTPAEERVSPPLGIGIPDSRGGLGSEFGLAPRTKLMWCTVILLGGLGIWHTNRNQRGRKLAPSEMEITSRLMLTPRTSLMLIKVKHRSVLCAVGPEQVTIIPHDLHGGNPFDDLLADDAPPSQNRDDEDSAKRSSETSLRSVG